MQSKLWKSFFKYGTFNIMGMLGISCYILADTFFIANGIGADGLAALNLAIPIYSFIHGCGLMLGTGGATKYIIAKTQGEHDRANAVFTNTLYTAILIAFVFMLCGLLGSDAITRLLRAELSLYEMTKIYIQVILLFSPFFISNELLLSFVRNDGNPALSMTAMISGSVANIILDYIFIYPCGMGILGAVLATGIAPMISILILSLHKLKEQNGFHLIRCSFRREIITETIVLGFPALITELSAGIVMIVFNLIIMELSGSIGIAAYGIIANIAIVSTAIYTGLAQGVQPLISQAHSTENADDARVYLKLSLLTVFILSTALYVLMYQFREPIAALFNSEQNILLQTIAVQGLVLYFTSIPFTGFNIVICAFFTATERPTPAHLISLLRGLILVVPMSYLLSAMWGLTGVWLIMTVTELLTAVFAAFLWHRQYI